MLVAAAAAAAMLAAADNGCATLFNDGCRPPSSCCVCQDASLVPAQYWCRQQSASMRCEHAPGHTAAALNKLNCFEGLL